MTVSAIFASFRIAAAPAGGFHHNGMGNQSARQKRKANVDAKCQAKVEAKVPGKSARQSCFRHCVRFSMGFGFVLTGSPFGIRYNPMAGGCRAFFSRSTSAKDWKIPTSACTCNRSPAFTSWTPSAFFQRWFRQCVRSSPHAMRNFRRAIATLPYAQGSGCWLSLSLHFVLLHGLCPRVTQQVTSTELLYLQFGSCEFMSLHVALLPFAPPGVCVGKHPFFQKRERTRVLAWASTRFCFKDGRGCWRIASETLWRRRCRLPVRCLTGGFFAAQLRNICVRAIYLPTT